MKRTSITLLALALALAVVLVPIVSRAEPIAYDNFESYAAGDLNANSGGTGWGGAWSADTSVDVVAKSLSYSSGSVTINGGSKAVEAGADNVEALVSRNFPSQTTGPVYMSFLFQGITSVDDVISVGLKEDGTGTHPYRNLAGVNFGSNGGAINAEVYGVDTTQARTDTGTTAVAGTTYFLVARISKSGGDFQSADVLVNPTSTTEPGSGWTNRNFADNTSNLLDLFRIRTAIMDTGDGFFIDEVQIGTTYDDVVTPIPEPGSIVLLLAGLLGLLVIPRRK